MAASDLTITVKLDDAWPEVAAVVKASVKLHDCQLEFEGLGLCGEHYEVWDSAVEALKQTRREQPP